MDHVRLVRSILVASAMVSITAAAQGFATQRIAVPAFFPVSTNSNGVKQDWTRILDMTPSPGPYPGAVQIVVAELGNLQSGTAFNPCTQTNTAPLAILQCLRTRGAKFLGYVKTGFGLRDDPNCANSTPNLTTSAVLTEVSQWYASSFASQLDGIFLDEGPQQNAKAGCREFDQAYLAAYYGSTTTGLFHAIRSAPNRSGPCGGEPCVMLNASQYEQGWAANAADYLTLWEKPLVGGNQNYNGGLFCPCTSSGCGCATAQSPAGWYINSVGARGAHVIHTTGDLSTAAVKQTVCTSSARGSPMIYTQSVTGSVYSQVSVDFEDLSSAVANCPSENHCGEGNSWRTDSCGITCADFGWWCPAPQTCQDLGGYYGCD